MPHDDSPECLLSEAACMVVEIHDSRASGDRETLHGNGDDDLLGAVEALEDAIKTWRHARQAFSFDKRSTSTIGNYTYG